MREEEAIRLVTERYGLPLEGLRASRLAGEYDDNFEITAADGKRYVLKVMHPSREPAFVDLQCAALRHLARVVPDLNLPRVQRALDERLFVSITPSDGATRIVWMLSWVEGDVLAKSHPHSRPLMFALGQTLGRLDEGLKSFTHPAAGRDLKWNLAEPLWAREALPFIEGASRQDLAARALMKFEADVQPWLSSMRRSVIYGDANDYNVIVSAKEDGQGVGLIDFGDMHFGITVAEIAVAAAYAMMGKSDPLAVAAEVAAGYHAASPLEDREFAVLFPLVGTRLAVSVANSASMKRSRPEDPYVTISEEGAWEALARWDGISPRLAEARFRHACGVTPAPKAQSVVRWLEEEATIHSVLDADLRLARSLVFDLSVSSLLLGADPAATATPVLTETLFGEMRRTGADAGVGRYDEDRKSVV